MNSKSLLFFLFGDFKLTNSGKHLRRAFEFSLHRLVIFRVQESHKKGSRIKKLPKTNGTTYSFFAQRLGRTNQLICRVEARAPVSGMFEV